MFIKAGLSGLLAVLLAAILSTSALAASDGEIIQFASGVVAGGLFTEDCKVSIEGGALIITDQLSEYSDGEVGTLGFQLYNMYSAADKVIKNYPGRFTAVEARLYDPTGTILIGTASVSVKS